MSLTKEQHDSIMYHYEQKQARRRRLLEQRRQEAYSAVPEYARLETEIPSAAVSRRIIWRSPTSVPTAGIPATSTGKNAIASVRKRSPSCMTSHIFSS